MGAFDDPPAQLSDLTAARGLLALWVFAYHTNLHLRFADLGGVIGRGYLGVDGFFMLSGLVLTHRHPALKQSVASYTRFWWRRLVRLYPTALAMLLLLGAGFLLAWSRGVHPHQDFRANGHEFVLQLLLLNGWGFSHGWTWNYPSWSISTEWAGYLLFPLLVPLAARLDPHAAGWGACVMGLCLVAVALTSPSGLNLSYQGALPRFLPEFIAGILLARLLRSGAALPPPSLIALLGALFFALGIWLRSFAPVGDAITTIGLWGLLWALAAGRQRIFTRLPAIIVLGALSYPFYMAYAPVELVFARLWGRLRLDPTAAPLLWLIPFFLGVLGLAWVTARFVERPALRHLAGRRLDS